ncbi:hypothetical protein ES705_44530 [subsurface metagenome]
MGMTYNKSDQLLLPTATSKAVEVDLGLGVDEAARILGVMVTALSATPTGAGSINVAYSFDPEDAAPAPDDDEQFFDMYVSVLLTTQGGRMESDTVFADFSGMNLITTRNLSFCAKAVGVAGGIANGKVYYEKYKPSVTDLNQLIARRR